MPNKPKHPCGYPGCPNLTHQGYCEIHQRQVNRNYNRYQRDEFSRTFYNTPRWRAIRKEKLKQAPFCEECIKTGTMVKATMVDHIQPIKQGGAEFDLSNLQSLCWSCHSRKSIYEGSRFGNVQARQ